ncbi:MAG TPA: hypothetical protein VJC12_03090 [Candidatus Paceibacterota bacterium]
MISYFIKNEKIVRLITIGLLVSVSFIAPIQTYAAWWFIPAAVGGVFAALGIAKGTIGEAVDYVTRFVGNLILGIMGVLLGIAGLLINQVINFTVVELKENIDKIGGINTVWGVIRDLINISFIFVLLYGAIKTILGVGDVKVKNLIIGVVISAILINFSMFFTKLMVDASNIVALVFYEKIAPQSQTLTGGISDTFMDRLGLVSLYDPEEGVLEEVGKTFLRTLLSSIILVIAAFTFFAGAIMFLIRFVNIILLIMLSPVAFLIGINIPAINEQAKWWWGIMNKELLWAPVYMILMWMVLTVIGTANYFGSEDSGLSLLVNFGIVIILLNAVLIISRKLAGQGGTIGAQVVGKFVGGVGGWAGRQAIGRPMHKIGQSKWFNKAASKMPLVGAAAIRGVKQVGEKSTFDVRAGKTFGDLGAGTPKGGGFRERQMADEKEIMGAKERVRIAEAKESIKKGTRAAEDPAYAAALATTVGARTLQQQALVDAVDQMEIAIGKMTGKEIETIVYENKKLLQSEAFANKISVQQLDTLNKSEKLSEAEKNILKDARFGEIARAIRTGPLATGSNEEKRLKALTDTELEMLPADLWQTHGANFANNLKRSQIDDIMKSKAITSSQKKAITDSRKAAQLNNIAVGVPAGPGVPMFLAPGEYVKKMDIKDIAGLDFFTAGVPNPALDPIYQYITPQMIRKIGRELEPQKALELKTQIMAHGDPATITWLNNHPDALG